jgi:cyclopropane-fatty-acyl-phospholipid synthase
MWYDDLLLNSARQLVQTAAAAMDAPFSIRLWDGSIHPLGPNSDPDLFLSIGSPGVLGAMLRRPTPENLIRHYARGDIDFHGADFMTFAERARVKNSRRRARGISKWQLVKNLTPFLFAGKDRGKDLNSWDGDEVGRQRTQDMSRDYIQFHYDISNDFYKLFLDERMVYTCAYFTDWNNSLDQAQFDKLEMICRKLRLEPGDRLLDIGCGWGALVMHAAEHYGVEAHGVTLSQTQVDLANERVRERGLQDRVKIDLIDYRDVDGTYNKVSSVGMIEHIGVPNYSDYMGKIASLMPDRGIFLNHGITRSAKRSKRKFMKARPEQRLLAKYIFPGGELGHIGNTIECMESRGFRVHDVEGWRDHYAMTCKHWCRRLWQNKEQAIELVGKEKFRIWLAYLGCVSLSLGDGSACIFQTVATRHKSRGLSTLPPTREYMYPTAQESVRRAA